MSFRLYRPSLARLLAGSCCCLLAVVTALAAPSVPTGLVAIDKDDGVQLGWQPSSGVGTITYLVQRLARENVTASLDSWQSAGLISETSWTQAGLAIDQSYQYRVVASDSTGVSAPSAFVVFARQRFGFVLPWNDTTPSPVFDFTPATKADVRLTASGGRLLRGTQPIRLVGVNMCAAACFPPPSEAAVVARRTAQFGINLVRFHQIDQLKPNGVFATASLTTLDGAQMDLLANFVRELADNGIYTNLNLHVSRTYASVDPKPARQRFKGVDIFSQTTGGADNLRKQQRDYASLFLSRNNAGIGPFRNYPAVSIIEINNEDGLLFEWTDGDLDKLAAEFPSYHAELRTAWTDWLRGKYGTDDALRAAWSAKAGGSYGVEFIAATPALGTPASPWQLQVIATHGAEASAEWIAADDPGVGGSALGPVLKVGVARLPSNGARHHVQLLYNNLRPDRAVPHTLRFRGKIGAGEAPRDFRALLRTGWGTVTYSIASLVLTPEWQDFTVVFPPLDSFAGPDDPAATTRSFCLTDFAARTGDIYLAGFSFSTGNVIAGPVASKAETVGLASANKLRSDDGADAFNFAAFPTSGWPAFSASNGATASTAIVADGRAPGVSSLRISVAPASVPRTGDAILVRTFSGAAALQHGETYQLRFDARVSSSAAAAGGVFTANGQLHGPPWTVFGSATFSATTEWKTYSVNFTVTDDSASSNRVGFGLGAIDGEIELANFFVRKGGQVGLPSGQSLDPLVQVEPLTKNEFYGRYRQVQTDWLGFLWKTELDYWIAMRDHVRTTVGTSALLVGTQGEMSPNLLQEAAGFDIVDAHGYWQHPSSFDPGWYAINTAMTGEPDLRRTTIPNRAGKRIVGKPYLVSEYAHPAPNTYGTEGLPLLGAYAALQGWSGFAAFEYEHVRDGSGKIPWDGGYEGWLTVSKAPAKMVTFPAALSLLARGHLASPYDGTLARTASVTISDATAIEIIRQTCKAAVGVGDFGLDPLLAYQMPVGMKRSPAVQPADARVVPVRDSSASASPVVATPGGELSWDSADARVVLKARRSKAAIGQLPAAGAVDLGDGVLLETPAGKLLGAAWLEGNARVEHPVKNWACFVLTRTDSLGDAPFGEVGTRWLLTTTGYADNHFIRWRDGQGPFDDKSSVINFGRAPSLVERITGTLSFSVPVGSLVARELDVNGDPGAPLVVSYSTTSAAGRVATVMLPERSETIWYSMEVAAAPELSAFERWRELHFSETGSPSAAPEADPDGDGLPNLLEYALGRLPQTPDAGACAESATREIDGSSYLTLSLRRRDDDPALSCVAESSPDLAAWSADAVLLPGAIDHGDGTVTVTYRDALPLAAGETRRFLRFRVTLIP